MAMSTVISVSVKSACHAPLQQPAGGCSQSGSSEIKWGFKGVYTAHGQCVVVVEAGARRDAKNCTVDDDGGIFPGGTDGSFCELTLQTGDLDNWAVKVATDKDKLKGKHVVFQAGSGLAESGGGAGK